MSPARKSAPHGPRSTAEAMALLNRYQSFLIQRGRWEALRRCARSAAQETGEVDARWVAQRLEFLGLLDEKDGRHWTGAVFNMRGGPWRWTGRYVSYDDAERNNHERTIKVWALASEWEDWCAEHGVDLDVPPAPPARPEDGQLSLLPPSLDDVRRRP